MAKFPRSPLAFPNQPVILLGLNFFGPASQGQDSDATFGLFHDHQGSDGQLRFVLFKRGEHERAHMFR